ncbi:MAG: sulfite exporter TauE/SafE family protein [bacterium]
MGTEVLVLAGTAAAIGFGHTILGPDHYLPFIVLSSARRWSRAKTALVTLACGIGHILSSVVLGFAGIALGIAVFKLEAIESARGQIAGWLLTAFGLAYLVWGLHRALRRRPHEHPHSHQDGSVHSHEHGHLGGHSHVHAAPGRTLTPWVLFTIFVFGPCEPLIPLIMYPAAKHNITSVALVASAFGLATLATMLAVVLASAHGLRRIPVGSLERYSHALAGLAILLCGGAMTFLGL